MLQDRVGDPGARLADFFDIFAGTSAGGILATFFSLPGKDGRPAFRAEQVNDFWTSKASEIFQLRGWPTFLGKLRNIWRPRWKSAGLERLLQTSIQEHCGRADITLKDTIKPILITSYDMLHGTPYFFMSERAVKDEYHNFKITDVCRATSAAPTFFKPANIESTENRHKLVCADGGLIANNPTMAALLHVVTDQKAFPPPDARDMKRRTIRDVLILSLGAGERVVTHTYDEAKKWGLLGWANPLLDVLVWGSGNSVHTQMCLLSAVEEAQDNYLRIEISSLPKLSVRLDNTSRENMDTLQKLADDAMQQKVTFISTMAGESVVLEQTNLERLEMFADKLVEEYRERLAEARGHGTPQQDPSQTFQSQTPY
eukprot:SM000093S24410  [mRNA]  locus=s93:185125:187287:- [translate_table: standard]